MKNLKSKGIKSIMLTMIIVLLCLCLARGSFACSSITLNVPMYYKDGCNLWCWNASAQMILSYHGSGYSQYTIANWAILDDETCRVNWLYGCGHDADDDNVFKYGIDYILDHFGGLDSGRCSSALTSEACSYQLNEDMPFLIRWDQSPDPGHIIVCRGILCGIGGPWLYINDSKAGAGQYLQTYGWVCSGGGHTWTHTLDYIH